MYLEILMTALVLMLASLAGVISIWKKAGNFVEKNLSYLVSLSAGVFLIISLELGLETLDKTSSPLETLLWIILGALLILIIFRAIPEFHHHHDDRDVPDQSHEHIDARRILIGDAIHNLGDGVLLAASFSINLEFGIITGLSIFVHEFVQEISEFFVLKQAGFSTKKAIWLNLIISTTILIGALGGYLFIKNFDFLEAPLIGIAAGSFLVVVFHDLIPHSVRKSIKKTDHLKHLLWFAFGVLLMFSVNLFTAHSNLHIEDEHHVDIGTKLEI